MFLIQDLHLLLSKLTPQSLQSLHKTPIINKPLILHIKESEPSLTLIPLILLHISFLPHFLIDGNFHLLQPVNSDSIIHQSITMDQIVDEKLLPFDGDTAVYVQVVLFELGLV